jgi:hypothetical protein
MTTAVKLFAHKGVVSVQNVRPAQAGTEGVVVLVQPYLARQPISATASATSSSASLSSSASVSVLRIEVEDSKSIRYEVNPPGRSVTADADSPRLSGDNLIEFGKDFTISVIEA